MRNAGLDEAQAGIKIAGRNIINLRYTDDNLMLSSAYLLMLADKMHKMHKNGDIGSLISGFSAFSKTSLNIWKFMVHILLKPGLKNFEHYFTSVGLPLWLSWYRTCLQCGRPRFSPWVGKIAGEGKGYPLQYSSLENSMNCKVYEVAELDMTERLSLSLY